MTRTIIAGSRSITDYAVVEEAIRASEIVPSVVLCGTARGVDRLGKYWARQHGIPVDDHPAEWGKYGKAAGSIRNGWMAENADALIAVWDGQSKGTKDMIHRAHARGLTVYVHDASFQIAPTTNANANPEES